MVLHHSNRGVENLEEKYLVESRNPREIAQEHHANGHNLKNSLVHLNEVENQVDQLDVREGKEQLKSI
jgi:hypothetical protein